MEKDKTKIYQERFDKFMELHPARNGRKIGKAKAKRKFFKLSDKDSLLILQATETYRKCKDVKNGVGIRDPHRFIKDGYGDEAWREWIGYSTPNQAPGQNAPPASSRKVIKRNPNTPVIIKKIINEMRKNGQLRERRSL